MKSTHKNFLSVLCAVTVISFAAGCSESNSSATTTTGSTTASSENSTTMSAPETSKDFEFTSSPAQTSNISTEVIDETTEIAAETTSGNDEITVPGYDPGDPLVSIYLQTTDIYPDTDKIIFSVNTTKEYVTNGDFYFYKETDNGWEKLERKSGSVALDNSISINKDNPLIINLYPADYGISFEHGENYRISKQIDGKEYDTYFIVGGIIPPLTENDIKMTIAEGSCFHIGDKSFTLNYKYVGNAEYAEYCFGCYYTLEKRNEKGDWEQIEFSENACFIDLGYLISTDYPTNSTTVTLSDDFYAEPLTAGTYRVVKPIEDNVTLTALFKLNDKYNLDPSATKADLKMTIENSEISTDDEFLNLKFEYIGEDNFAEFSFGTEFYIEKDNNGKWEKVEFADEVGWDDVAYMIGTENPEQTLDIYIGEKIFKEPLSSGKYRVVKPMNIIDDIFNLTAEFTIESGHFKANDFIVTASPRYFAEEDKDRALEITYEYIGNDRDINVRIYDDYRIFKLNSDEKWDEVPFSSKQEFGKSYIDIKNDSLKLSETIVLKDEYFKKPLSEGTYKIIKDLCDCTSVSAVFYIGEPKLFTATIKEECYPITTNSNYILIDIEYIGSEDDFLYEFNMGSYRLEKYENGKWKRIRFSDEAAFDDGIDNILPEQRSFTLYADLNDISYQEPITAGTYRIVHHSYQDVDVSVEFEIEEPGLVIDSENGSITLTINEINPDGFVCSLPWPYPATYTVECDTSEYDDYCIGDNIEVDYATMYKISEWEYLLIPTAINMSDFYLDNDVAYKPVIYLYPQEETDVSVKLYYNGRLTVTYPEYGDGWNVTAMPDGTLYDEDGNEYSYLFWEGESNTEYDFSKGFCVKGEDTVEFLRWALSTLGLTPREYNEFIVFWLPFMQDNEYNIISFQSDTYTDNAVLTITPDPDTILRVFMAFYASDEYVEIEEQILTTTEREGFTVVEWGGTIVG